MDAEELLVHDGSEGKGTKGLGASLVDSLGILVLALDLEGEVISQMTALVITAE